MDFSSSLFCSSSCLFVIALGGCGVCTSDVSISSGAAGDVDLALLSLGLSSLLEGHGYSLGRFAVCEVWIALSPGLSHNASECIGSSFWLEILVEFFELFLQITLVSVLEWHCVFQVMEKAAAVHIGLELTSV